MRQVPFFRVDCGGNELRYVEEVLRSGWLTTARFAARLEEEFARKVGAKHAIAVNSCTSALHLAAEAVGVGPGDRVLVPSLTFTATAEVVRYLGGEVVLCDVDSRTGLLTPEIVDRSIAAHPGLKAVMLVHFAGLAADLEAIAGICRARGIAVIEDAAHAFPTRYPGGRVSVGAGSSSFCCFSFYANKTMTTGEGGMLVTADDALAARARLMRLHGIDRDVWARFTDPRRGWMYDVVAPGFKYNMPDLNAAVGLAQLERADEFHLARVRLVGRYLERLASCPFLVMPSSPDDAREHAWHLFAVRLGEDAPIDRDGFIRALGEAGVGTSVHYRPLHRMKYWAERCGAEAESFPNAERWWNRTVSLPLFPGMSDEDHDHVCDTVLGLLSARPTATAGRS